MVNEKMTVIADSIRSLLGLTEAMGLDAMATNLGTEQTNIADAFTAVGNKGGTVPESKVSGNLASAIDTILTGATIQRKTGSFTTTSSGAASVDCGFKPDAVFIYASRSSDTSRVYYAGVSFLEYGITSVNTILCGPDNSYPFSTYTFTQSNSGFSVSAKKLSTSWSESADANRTINYVAVKYS